MNNIIAGFFTTYVCALNRHLKTALSILLVALMTACADGALISIEPNDSEDDVLQSDTSASPTEDETLSENNEGDEPSDSVVSDNASENEGIIGGDGQTENEELSGNEESSSDEGLSDDENSLDDENSIDNESNLVGADDSDSEENNTSNETNNDEEELDPLDPLNLPENYYNYANIPLPEYYTENQFPENTRFTQAVTFYDNTPLHNPITDAGATLGRVLFYDKKLSQNGTTSCASCHQQAHGFSDPDVLSLGFEGRAKQELDGSEARTGRHSMGLANARFYYGKKFFWDERADTLEDQVLMPFQDEVEMGLTLDELERIVSEQSYYAPLFEAAFGQNVEITSENISLALAQFIRSMVSVSSRYDDARAQVNSPLDDFPGFTASENAGKRLFFAGKPVVNSSSPNGRANCQGCHTTEAFIAAVPDDPMQLSAIDNGLTSATNNGLDLESILDFGVGETTGRSTDNGKFKTTSLKNIAIRPPYMHDGRFATLEAVIDHYSSGIQAHDNLAPPLTGRDRMSAIQFNFTAREKADLVAFLRTLTDEDMINDEKYSNPFKEG